MPITGAAYGDDMESQVVVLGSVNVDITAVLEHLPQPGETVSGGVLQRGHGGKGANQSVAAARAGASVRFVGAVGQDADGDDVLATLAAEGVDVAAVRRVDAATGTALICVDAAGENQIAVAPGANRHASATDVDLTGAAVAIAQLEAPLDAVAAFFGRARAAGARTILNAAPIHPGAEAAIIDLLDVVDVLVVNRHELAALTDHGTARDARPAGDVGALAATLVRGTPGRTVLVTLGAGGVVHVAPTGEVDTVAGHPVDAIDTVGAGDAFCGVLGAALAAGYHPTDAVRRANAAGALATVAAGARSAPTATAVDALLALTSADPPGRGAEQ